MSCKFLVRHFFLWRVPDYLMIICLAVVAAVVGYKVRPHCRVFEWDDPSINYPYDTKEDFPMYSVVVAVVLVALIYLVGELCSRWNRPVGKLNMCLHLNGWVVTHAYSIILAFAFVNITKLYAGRLRPDFIARLAREGITQANASTLTAKELCHAGKSGRVSFPSGHSGTAFSGFLPPCMYLMGLMRSLNGGRVWVATLAMIPLILPITVAISRTGNYRHNFDDILAGSLCGALCGILAVLLSFRPSQRGEWTLKDHPDDKGLTRAWLRDLIGDSDVSMVHVPRRHRDDRNESNNDRPHHRSHDGDDDDDDDDYDDEQTSAEAMVPSSKHHRAVRNALSPPSSEETKKSAVTSVSEDSYGSSLPPSMHFYPDDFPSPHAASNNRSTNPSPTTHMNLSPQPPEREQHRLGGGRHHSSGREHRHRHREN